MKKRLLLLLAAGCLLLSGCGGRKLEEELLVIVLAVDVDQNGDYTIGVKAPKNAASSGAQDDGQGGYLILEASGHSFSDAAAMLNAVTPRQLNYSQVREIVIGSEAARRDGLAVMLRQIDAMPRLRCSAALVVCREKAVDFIQAQKPYVGLRLSRYTEATVSNYAGKGFTPATTLCDAVRDMGGGLRDPLLILGAVNPFSEEAALNRENPLDDTAGSLPRKSGEQVELFGAAATDGARVTGYLTGYDMALIHLIEGHVEALVIRDETEKPLHVLSHSPARLTVDLNANPVRLAVSLTCEVRYLPGDQPEEYAVAVRLQADITDLLSRMQGMGCDGLGFGHLAARQFLTVPEWERVQWKSLYKEASVAVQVAARFTEH